MKIKGVELILDEDGNVIAGLNSKHNRVYLYKLDSKTWDYIKLNPVAIKTAKQGLYKGRYFWK